MCNMNAFVHHYKWTIKLVRNKKMFGIICKYDYEEDFRIVFFCCNTKKSASGIVTPQSSRPAGKFLGITIYIVVSRITYFCQSGFQSFHLTGYIYFKCLSNLKPFLDLLKLEQSF